MWLFIEEQRNGAFLFAILCGFGIGLLYDCFRIARAVWNGGRIRLFFEDVLFCVLAAALFVVFCFNVTLGVVRLFLAIGALFGFFAYRFTLGLLTVYLVRRIKAYLKPYILSFCNAVTKKLRCWRARRYTRKRIIKIGSILN